MPGFAGLLLIHLHFPEAASLKGKRKELKSVKEQLRGRLGVSVSEVDHHDKWQRSTLAAAVVGQTAGEVHGAADRVERFLDSRVPDHHRVERTVVSFEEVL